MSFDTLGMREAALSLPEQISSALDSIDTISGLPDPTDITNVVFLGMGDSGYGGAVTVAVAREFSPVPLTVYRGYLPPSYVNSSSLVVAISASGRTEETLEALEAAVEAGARLVGVTGGGELANLVHRANGSVLPVSVDAPMPRTAIGALAVPAMLVLEQMGFFPGARVWLAEAVRAVEQRREALSAITDTAEAIAGTVPVIYGGGSIGSAAARRWKNAVNHNAKHPAFWASMPELCHNELAGWTGAPAMTEPMFSQIQLHHDFEHPQTSRRFEFLTEATSPAFRSVHEIHALGDGPTAQLFDMIFYGDLMSLELARLTSVDPGPVPVADQLKARLERPTD